MTSESRYLLGKYVIAVALSPSIRTTRSSGGAGGAITLYPGDYYGVDWSLKRPSM